MSFTQKLDGIVTKFAELEKKLLDPSALGQNFAKVSKEHSDAAPVVELIGEYRRAQKEIADQRVLFAGLDLATRNLRVITRRIDYLLDDQKPRPELAAVIAKTLIAVELLEQSLDDFSLRAKSQKYLSKLIRALDPKTIGDAGLSDQVVFMQIRPMVVDLAIAAGVEPEQARKLLPKVD